LSTQHIEEADHLSDRVCIMSHGKIIALDTPTALKRNFGVGYDLLIEKLSDQDEAALPEEQINQAVLEMDFVEGAVKKENADVHKLIYQIPFE
jgi:ABC-2 type transport system ATP-binding protein